MLQAVMAYMKVWSGSVPILKDGRWPRTKYVCRIDIITVAHERVKDVSFTTLCLISRYTTMCDAIGINLSIRRAQFFWSHFFFHNEYYKHKAYYIVDEPMTLGRRYQCSYLSSTRSRPIASASFRRSSPFSLSEAIRDEAPYFASFSSSARNFFASTAAYVLRRTEGIKYWATVFERTIVSN